MKFLIMQSSPVEPLVLPSQLKKKKYISQHPILKEPLLIFSLYVSDQFSYPYINNQNAMEHNRKFYPAPKN